MLLDNDSIINDYRIIKLLGQGAMGNVYLAIRNSDGKELVLKELKFSEETGLDKETVKDIFKREAEFLSKFHHRGLPKISGTFHHEERDYLVMEYIKGETLETIINKEKKPVRETKALEWSIEIAEILHYLHNSFNSPVVYRDLKPSNIIITEDGVKLVDFGTSRYYNPDKQVDTYPLGSPGYAAPEQYKNRGQSSPQSDIFALGVILYEMLTKYDPSKTPFKFPPVRQFNNSVSKTLEKIVMRAIELDPLKRYISAMEFKETVEKYLGIYEDPVRKKPEGKYIDTICAAISAIAILTLFMSLLLGKNINHGKGNNSSIIFPEMVLVKGGTVDIKNNKEPACNVPSFYTGKYEITNEEFCIFLNKYSTETGDIEKFISIKNDSFCGIEKGSPEGTFSVKEGYEKYPVVYVNYYGAKAYCDWLNKIEGKELYYLPSETQWEYACRGGSSSDYYWGKDMNGSYCWYKENSEEKLHPVGQKEPNPYGLYDMSGNVWEWCSIAAGSSEKSEDFSIRGGSFSDLYCKSSSMESVKADFLDNKTGFRIVKGE